MKGTKIKLRKWNTVLAIKNRIKTSGDIYLSTLFSILSSSLAGDKIENRKSVKITCETFVKLDSAL